MIDVAANWQRVRDAVAAAAEQAGRDPRAVRIVAVSKTKPVELIEQAVAAGATDIGENYVQEAAAKIPRVHGAVSWHFIGRLQRNKARRAVELFRLIHTVDDLRLALLLDRLGMERGGPVHALIEVNTGGEPTKAGLRPDEVEALLTAVRERRGLSIDGLMTVPPPGAPDATRRFFRTLRQLRDDLRARLQLPLAELSMGMTDDFTIAIEEGATLVRIGRGIFGAR